MFTSVVSQCSDKRHPFRDSLSTFGGVAVRTCGSCFTGGRPNRGCDLILPPLMRMCTPIQAAPPLLPVRLLSNGVSIGLELACRATAALPSGEESGQSRRLRDAFTSRSIISPVSGQTRNLSIFPVCLRLKMSRQQASVEHAKPLVSCRRRLDLDHDCSCGQLIRRDRQDPLIKPTVRRGPRDLVEPRPL